MTRDEAARIADPELFTAFRRFRILFGVLLLAIVFLAAAVTWQTITNTGQEERITRVERSPCFAAPESPECQTYTRELLSARSVETTCMMFESVGYACPVGRVRQALADQ